MAGIATSTMPDSMVVRGRESWFYSAMATVATALAVLGFGPALMEAASRRAPLTLSVGAHGVVFAAWLLLFLAQSLLVKKPSSSFPS